MRAVYILIFVFVCAGSLYSIKSPVVPRAPIVKGATNQKPLYNPLNSKKPKKRYYRAVIHLADGRTVAGKVPLPASVFRIRQTVNGIRYTKTIRMNRTRSITILSWKALYRGSSAKGARLYYFVPVSFAFVTVSGRSVVRRRLKQFDRITLTNRFGTTALFSYFADYWDKEQWRNSGSRDFRHNNSKPNPACFIRIVFPRSSGKRRARGR